MHASGEQLCPECRGTLRTGEQETVCTDCGLVVETDRIDRGPEWRSFDEDERERTGAPLTPARHDMGLSTEIGRDRNAPAKKRRRFARLRTQHHRANAPSKVARNRREAFIEIRRMVGRLSLPDPIRDRACVLFASAQDDDLLRGRSIEGIATAALYAICRIAGVSRTLAEVAAVSRVDRGRLKNCYGVLNRAFDLETGPIDPAEYLPRFATELGIETDVERRARELAVRATEEGIASGRNPAGVAAACLYTAARESDVSLTQREAADVADVAAATLRETYHQLR
ncbi:transcription initiation factor IIB [Halapricum desulfuricans]|uniref:Transcription initiation factor TFIIB, Brf1 subunit/Transcription initiation factor TFIIB n=1 Tax=Halapricum desulfuricans TaxID=2841257 RepID=A0A897N7Z9_9EURY|nr:transcription initiation factor IIB family protein [Halapricum desulfuricans]QSG07303.1 Transcription initiation factor TFIIB, Brf1 subunit/Transcription initiation factor TFIIB [Halapricum desulfuricans]